MSMQGSFRPGSAATLSADALIIGSGAGGASVAEVLTRAGLDVIMLEEGNYVPAASADPGATAAFPRSWRGGGLTPALGIPPIAYAEGCCVGGGTEINSGIFQETDPELLDSWAQRYRIDSFGAAALAPYFAEARRAVNASLTSAPLGPPTDILRRAGNALGWQVKELERGQRGCVGTNMCSFVCPTGGKQSMSNTLLPRAISRGMRLLANTRAERLVIANRRVTAVRAVATGPDGRRLRLTVTARRVFLCAGAVHTPTLLRRSGLRQRIGDTLRLHPTLKCSALFPDVVDAHRYRLPLTAITEFAPDQRIGGAVFTPAIFALSLAEDWGRRQHLMAEWRRCGSYYAMIRPRGTGRIRPLPFLHEPLVLYRLTPEDWVALRQATLRLAQAMFAAGAEAVYPSITGHDGWTAFDQAKAELEAALPASRTNLMTIHLFSSCPPGEDRQACATDSFGRVRGVENLIVADGSGIPEAPGVNPQATIMALAWRAADAALAASRRGVTQAALREAA